MTSPLSIQISLPISWQEQAPASMVDPVLLLRVMALLEMSPSHHEDDDSPESLRWQSLEARVELMLQMVGQILARGECVPPTQQVELSGERVIWTGSESVDAGHAGYVGLYLSPRIPQPLMLPATISACQQIPGGAYRIQADFVHLDADVQDWIEKTVFRRHRRQIFEKKHPHDTENPG